MAFLTLKCTLLLGVSCFPTALGLPGPALIARNALDAQNSEAVGVSQRPSIGRADEVLARALQIVSDLRARSFLTAIPCEELVSPRLFHAKSSMSPHMVAFDNRL